MIQGLFWLCMFFISVFGILLFRPDPIASIAHYSEPAQIEERKQVTLKMVELLEKHPEVLQQTRKLSNTSLGKPIEPLAAAPAPPSPPQDEPLSFPFQGEAIEFKTRKDLNAWIYDQTKRSPVEFVDHIMHSGAPAETKLEILTTAGQSDDSEATTLAVKEASLLEAQSLIQSHQGRDQQLTQKFLELFIEKESDPRVGKERVDELLRASSTPPGSP